MSRVLDVMNALKTEHGIPFAYDHFAEGEAPEPPFVVYRYPSRADFRADDRIYFPVHEVAVELYTDYKDLQLEKMLESLFEAAGIVYDRIETWIQSERLYQVYYQFEEEA